MLSIRMRRTGAKKNPHFRVVVADSSNSPDGAFIEVLGHYHPRFEPARVVLDMDALKAWIEKGARPSDTVRTLMKQIETGKLEMTHEPAGKPERAAAEADPAAEGEAAAEGEVAAEAEPAGKGEAAAEGEVAAEAEPAGKGEAAAETEAGAAEEEGQGDEEEAEEDKE